MGIVVLPMKAWGLDHKYPWLAGIAIVIDSAGVAVFLLYAVKLSKVESVPAILKTRLFVGTGYLALLLSFIWVLVFHR
jgi:phosphatidylglycerophosphate synthase